MRKVIIIVLTLMLVSTSYVYSQGGRGEVDNIAQKETAPFVSPEPIEVDESKTITLELKNMDVVEVVKLLSSKGGFDIVISNNVRGRVSLFLDDVPVWDAIQIVFQTADLAYTKHEGIYRILTGREYEQEYGRKFYDQRKMKIINIKYAGVEEIVRNLKSLKSRIGNVIPDMRTNAVIILDTEDSIRDMEEAIKELDVLVETKVFDLKYSSAKSLEAMLKKILSKKGMFHVDDLTNKIVITDRDDVLEQAMILIGEYDKPTVLETKVFTLMYSKNDKMVEKVKDLLTKDIGTVKGDERTNKVVVTDLPQKMRQIEELIAEYDEKDLQVLIEAKIVQVALNDNFSMGINWNLVLNKVWVDRIFNTDTMDLALSSVFSTLSEIGRTDTDPFDSSTRSGHPGGRMLVSGTLASGHDFDTIIEALKVAGETNLLSSPRILALNNEKASIKVGTREAFVTNTVVQSTSSSTTAENVTFVDVGILLTVTPTINKNDFITLQIKPEVSNVSRTITTSQGNQVPIVATQEAETVVMVKSGSTVVMGGLIEDQQYKTSSRIPILGSVPILGIPFRTKADRVVKNELVIFLTPYLVSGGLDLKTPSPKMLDYLEKIDQERQKAADEVEFEKKQIAIKPIEKESTKVERNQSFTHR